MKTHHFFLFLVSAVTASAQSLNITNDLQLWLKADTGVITNAAGGVAQWLDQSTNANNAIQSVDAMAPTLVNNALNSRPVLRFDGADDEMDVADSESVSFTGDVSSFFVIKFDDFDTYRAVWSKTLNNLPAPTDIYTLPNSGVLRVFRGDGTLNNLSSADTAQALRANTYLVLGFAVEGTNLTHFLNNQDNGAGIVNTTTADRDTLLKIGTRNDFVTRLKGDVAELLIYSRALSSIERSNVFSYLQTKYNLLNLPPSISLSSTPAGPNVTVGQIVTLSATASDLDGTIARVDFFANGNLIATATRPPYSARMTIDSAGTATFTARATDDKSAIANSVPISLTAAPPGPADLPVTAGLQLWLRADAGVDTGTPGAVINWADQSGNGNSAAQVDENLSPTYVENAVNGRPAIRFDGVNDYLEVPDADSISFAGDLTTFFVVRFADLINYRAIWAKTVNNLPAPTDMYTQPNNGRLRFYRGNATGPGSQFVDASQPFAAGTFLLGSVEVAANTIRHYYNGTPNGTGAMTITPADGDTPLRIGTRGDLFTKMKGEMAEILIFDRSLGADERRAVHRYLIEKYGLPALVTPTNAIPNVAITSPTNQVLQAPGEFTVTAVATDADGSIVSVQFLLDGRPIGADTTAPFATNFNLTYGGGLTLTAIAQDNLGNRVTSAPVFLCAQGPGAPTGLVGYWPLNGNAVAAFGTSGIMVSNPVPALDRNGNSGGAVSFDGLLQQRVEIPGGGGLNAASRGTISMWVKWTGAQDTGFGGAAGAVLSRQRDGAFSDNIINLSSSDPDSAVVQWRQNSAGTINVAGTLPVGNDFWRHIVVTFTQTNSAIFVDSILDGTGTGGVLHDNAAQALAIGAWTGGGGAYATASVDDVAIWNRVLSEDEIFQLTGGTRTPLTLLITPDCLTIERSGPNAIVRWRSEGILQQASEVTGPFEDVANATNPYSASIANASKFFRLRAP